jgi:hypothetical protein
MLGLLCSCEGESRMPCVCHALLQLIDLLSEVTQRALVQSVYAVWHSSCNTNTLSHQ